jgi:hypothetical protein
MDEANLLTALSKLDGRLAAPFDVVIIGGAAMILHFGASRATRDVDVIVLKGDPRKLRAAVRAISADMGLPDDWLNDGVKGFASVLPPDFRDRLQRLVYPFEHLGLYVLGLPDQVTMKIVALRAQDIEDLTLLLPRLTSSDRRVVIANMHHLSRLRPDWAQRMQYFLEEQGWNLD